MFEGNSTSSSGQLGDLPIKFKLDLHRGPLGIDVSHETVAMDVNTPTAIVSSAGKNRFGVAYNPATDRTTVAALQYPVSVRPTSGNQAPFTLAPGQQVEVSSEGIGAVIPVNQTSNNGTAPGPVATGLSGAGNATAGNPTADGKGISSPAGTGISAPGTSTGGALNPSGNNQIGDATQVSIGQSISQTISPAGSSNFYRRCAQPKRQQPDRGCNPGQHRPIHQPDHKSSRLQQLLQVPGGKFWNYKAEAEKRAQRYEAISGPVR